MVILVAFVALLGMILSISLGGWGQSGLIAALAGLATIEMLSVEDEDEPLLMTVILMAYASGATTGFVFSFLGYITGLT